MTRAHVVKLLRHIRYKLGWSIRLDDSHEFGEWFRYRTRRTYNPHR